MNAFYILSWSELFKKLIYIISRFSRGARRATRTHRSLLGKSKEKVRELPFIVSRGKHFTATCWSVGHILIE